MSGKINACGETFHSIGKKKKRFVKEIVGMDKVMWVEEAATLVGFWIGELSKLNIFIIFLISYAVGT